MGAKINEMGEKKKFVILSFFIGKLTSLKVKEMHAISIV